MFKCFGYKDPIRLEFRGTVCSCCMLEFNTREKLSEHLKHRSKLCYKYVSEYVGALLSQEEADALDLEDRILARDLKAGGFRRHHSKKKSLRTIGPLPPVYSHISDHIITSNHHVLGRGRRNLHQPPASEEDE